MSLVISIIKFPDNVAVSETSKTFAGQGGSIGRGKDNTWVLSDPERYLSACHCQITYENGVYCLIDTSTNGTFLNGSVEPMGKGARVTLNAGDQFSLGEYEFSVTALNVDMMGAGAPIEAAPMSDPFADVGGDGFNSDFQSQSGSSFDDPFSSGHIAPAEPLFSTAAEETDPLAALDKARQVDQPDQFASNFPGASQADQADPINQSIDWPRSNQEFGQQDSGAAASGGIPENWDKTDLSYHQKSAQPAQEVTPPYNEQAAPPSSPQAPIPEPVPTQPQPVHQASPEVGPQTAGEPAANPRPAPKQAARRASSSADTTLIEILGLTKHDLSPRDIAEINCTIGELMRETILGLMQVLSSRNSIKNEFRMSVTTIQPVENNPLKFSANVDDALENMFIKKGNSYKKPVEAVREGFRGIAEHQIAILAGMRHAFKGVIERFDPLLLEKRFEKRNKGGLIPGSQKAKNWDSYTEYYNDLVGDLDNSFQYLFGDDFVKAYEDQLQKLAIDRQSNKSNGK